MVNLSPKALRLFYSYSHKDEAFRERLETHLSALKRQGNLDEWHDRKISPGREWGSDIDQNLDLADVILLLVSADFIASDYCYGIEMKRAMERHEGGKARVIPIIIKPVDWVGTSFGKLQALPKNARPVTKWSNRDEAWTDVVKGIRKALEELAGSNARTPDLISPRERADQAVHHPQSNGSEQSPVLPTGADQGVADFLQIDDLAEVKDLVVLAKTATSQIFLGRHSEFGKVILKISPSLPPESMEWVFSDKYADVVKDRLLRRGRLSEGQVYLLFRFLEGYCLSEVVRPGNVLVGAVLDEIILQVLHQLAVLSADKRRVVHRDVTPSNLILTLVNARPSVSLIDWEMGCFGDSVQVPVRARGFSSPEQDRGQAVPSSDLYSLVSTAYFLATGMVPPDRTINQVGFPSECLGVMTYLEDVYGHEKLIRSWSLDVNERPSSAQEFLSAQRIPGTRLAPLPKNLGQFKCGKEWTLDLFNTHCSIQGGPHT